MQGALKWLGAFFICPVCAEGGDLTFLTSQEHMSSHDTSMREKYKKTNKPGRSHWISGTPAMTLEDAMGKGGK